MKRKFSVVAPKSAHAARKTVLEIKNLRKVFSAAGGYRCVLEDVNFKAKDGELICIFGKSGCGKTTLLKILAGFIAPSSGCVLLNDAPVTVPGPDRCVVFQEDALFPWLTVKENVAFGLKGRSNDKARIGEEVERFLALVGLSEFENYLPQHISGGMKQRVALARVLILQPKILLMDEPFASLDAQTREEMQYFLLSLWEKLTHTILFVTHDVTEAIALADRVVVMGKDPGRIREIITVDLERPRKKETDEFLRYSQYLYEVLRR